MEPTAERVKQRLRLISQVNKRTLFVSLCLFVFSVVLFIPSSISNRQYRKQLLKSFEAREKLYDDAIQDKQEVITILQTQIDSLKSANKSLYLSTVKKDSVLNAEYKKQIKTIQKNYENSIAIIDALDIDSNVVILSNQLSKKDSRR